MGRRCGERFAHHDASLRPRVRVLQRRDTRDNLDAAVHRLEDIPERIARAPNIGAGSADRECAVRCRGATGDARRADVLRCPWRRQRSAGGRRRRRRRRWWVRCRAGRRE